jgi:hypothetical protein
MFASPVRPPRPRVLALETIDAEQTPRTMHRSTARHGAILAGSPCAQGVVLLGSSPQRQQLFLAGGLAARSALQTAVLARHGRVAVHGTPRSGWRR